MWHYTDMGASVRVALRRLHSYELCKAATNTLLVTSTARFTTRTWPFLFLTSYDPALHSLASPIQLASVSCPPQLVMANPLPRLRAVLQYSIYTLPGVLVP